MPTSSLVKFANRTQSNGKKLWWNRADIDGLPFRGPFAPIMPEEEYQERVVRIADFRNAFFDVMDPAENRKYCEIMECCANGWFQLRHQIFFWRATTKHYVEWMEYYLEDGSRTPFTTNGLMEMAHGPQNFLTHPGAG